jgi:anaphase-promoting complex subunit 10
MRIYLDFGQDESYTPTMIRFAAGTGYNDLQEFSTMRFEQPRGWMEVDFGGVGEAEASEEDEDEMKDESEEEKENTSKMPVLRCMLVQVRICENHQNGKDTHLRGLQIFGRDRKRVPERISTSVSSNGATASGAEKKRKKLFNVPAWATVPELR